MNITIGNPWAVSEKGGRLNNEAYTRLKCRIAIDRRHVAPKSMKCLNVARGQRRS